MYTGDSSEPDTGTMHLYRYEVRGYGAMNLETARNEIRYPSRVTGMEILAEAALFIAIAALVIHFLS
jgi:hypothetical protein